jgi:two-component system CheB/CheR fusion protein
MSEPTDGLEPEALDANVQVVGVGASAGGLEAFSQLLRSLPPDTGLAFVLVQHLAPAHASALAEILGRETTMPVLEVEGAPEVLPNHVYVIPPAHGLLLRNGALNLVPRPEGIHHPIDQFFRSLAEARRHRAIGVVLSGTANDGSAGLEAIKAEGGVTFAQDESARHDGMPHSAITTGIVDFVLAPDAIAAELVRITRNPETGDGSRDALDDPAIPRIVQALHQLTGLDFSQYKLNTLFRRISRRMQLQHIGSLAQYAEFLQEAQGEARALQQDLLISVTSFFRDPPAFEALRASVFPALLRDRSPRDPVRAWTAGCSTGQEAYSIAIAFAEYSDSIGSKVPLQLFATDVNAASIDIARGGLYGNEIADDMSPERLSRFFTQVDGHYRIRKEIRDSCIFSVHNVAVDPPFSRVDLLCCRNLLIYLEPPLQKRILPLLHYALKPGGFLWLGGSETVGAQRHLFDTVDAKYRIFSPRTPGGRGAMFPTRPAAGNRLSLAALGVPDERGSMELPKEADRILAARFGPAAVLVTRDLDILQFRGYTEPFLTQAQGKATLNLLKMLREGLLVGVRSAVLKAISTNASVREPDLRVKEATGFRSVNLEVIPVPGQGGAEGGFLVVFDDPSAGRKERPSPTEAPAGPIADDERDRVRLEEELQATRAFMQSVIEQQEASNEELQSANEEIQSANEELQSINEELETTKEEIQSSNEELATLNEELNHRNAELGRLNDDLANLMSSVHMPIVMVGRDFRIRRFTASAERLLHLIPSDLGRPISDIRLHLEHAPELEPVLAEVLDTMSALEFDVQDGRGRWYSLRLRPYRTLDNRIDGVVLMLVDIDDLMLARQYLEGIVATVREPLLVLDPELRVRTGSDAFYLSFGMTPANTVGASLFELGNRQWDIPALRAQLTAMLTEGSELKDFEVEHEFPRLGRRTMVLNARRVHHPSGGVQTILLAIEDRTDQRAWARRLEASEAEARHDRDQLHAIYSMAPLGLCLLDRDLRYIMVNETLAAMNGMSVADHIGHSVREIVPDLADAVEPPLRNVLRTGVPVIDTELRGMTAAEPGVVRTWVESWYPLRDERDEIIGVNVIARDVTAEAGMRRALQSTTAQLQDADHRKDEFLAMLAHELRNPLAPIRNALQVLRMATGNDPQSLTAAAMMERQVAQMVRLVDDLLDVSRITRGTIELRKGRVKLQDVIREAIEAAHPMCDERGHQLESELPPEPIHVRADPARLMQIVGNLLHNACKYTRRGGRIRVRIHEADAMAVITISDNGIGLSADELLHVFDLFMQADTSLTRSGSGLGIGLTLVKRLTEQHGGTVRATSTGPGLGSEFVVRLPIDHGGPDAPLAPRAAQPDAAHALKVLLVDDNRDSADSLATLLQLHGHTTRVAYDGLLALDAAEAFQPDTILLDIGLPNLSGYEVARLIRARAWGQRVKLIALTGWGQKEARVESEEAGFDAHLVKPVDLEELLSVLGNGSRA